MKTDQLVRVIKIGGNVIDHQDQLQVFLQAFAKLKGPAVLVHGGGKIATRIGEQLGIQSSYVDGRRITDEATLDLVTMVYGGLVNKKMVAGLQALGCNAIGLTGADANIIPAHKRPVKTIDYGWVGDVDSSRMGSDTLRVMLQAGLTPVFAPLTHDGKGHMLNTNADTIASSLAVALSSHFNVHLLYCFEKRGVLQSVDDEHSVISYLNRQRFDALREAGNLHSGIIPKIENALAAIGQGVSRVIIGHASDLEVNISEKCLGTIIE